MSQALKEHTLSLVCLEDWQAAYVDDELVAEGHEVNLIDIINTYKTFKSADWTYLDFPSEASFETFMYWHFENGVMRMPETKKELESWII